MTTRFVHVNEITRINRQLANALKRLGQVETAIGVADQAIEDLNDTETTIITGVWGEDTTVTNIVVKTLNNDITAAFPISTTANLAGTETTIDFSRVIYPAPTVIPSDIDVTLTGSEDVPCTVSITTGGLVTLTPVAPAFPIGIFTVPAFEIAYSNAV